MALAILDLLGTRAGQVRFSIDTGTNPYHQLKIGRACTRRGGIDWVDDVYSNTPLRAGPPGARLLATATEIGIPLRTFDRRAEHAYIQLFSFKTKDGKSPAVSPVVDVPLYGGAALAAPPLDYEPPLTLAGSVTMTPIAAFESPRTIPCGSYADRYARTASLEDLLSGIVKVAAPALRDLLNGAASPPGGAGAGGGGGTGAGAPSAGADQGPGGMIARLLKSLIEGIAAPPKPSTPQSLGVQADMPDNRFVANGRNGFSRPFIFGIDDALIGTILGPVLNVLPQLVNSANQQRVQLKQADNKLVTDLLSDVNKRLMLQQVVSAQRAGAPGAASGADIQQLLQLLQQAQAAGGGAAAAPPAAPVQPSSIMSLADHRSPVISRGAVVTFVTASPVAWNGAPAAVFSKKGGLTMRIRLDLTGPAPAKPAPKAIVELTFKDAGNQAVAFRKAFQQKNLVANTELKLGLSPEEAARLPANRRLTVFACVRWLVGAGGGERKAIGSTDIVAVDRCFLKEQGGDVAPERELVDTKRFRPFWNKVWEAPSLDGHGKRLWELNVTAKYSVLLSPNHNANGLMQTKILSEPVDADSVSVRTEGRLKAGIDLSLDELNKLTALWEAQPLADEQLDALRTDAFARNNAAELIHAIKLKGRAGERGMVWVSPTFKLFELTLAKPAATDEYGQVTALAEEKVRFPLPVAGRVIGLKSAR